MTQVEINDLRKSFGPVETLHGVSFEIPEGAFAALVGPSGCGKSTILRLIAGLEEVTSGDIRIGDRVVNDVESKNRDIAMVFQNYALYPHMTVAQNMGFSLRLLKKPKKDIETAVHEAATILGIDGLLDRFPKQLSGGQRQRVAMGRAIVRQPQVFLFDEPLSNLDAKLRVQMRAELKAMHQRLRTTTIYVTHDQIEAMTMADIVVVMRDGHVEQVGRPLELYDRPVNRFVAGFIGSPAMNFVPVTSTAGADAVVLADGQSLDLPQFRALSGAFDLGLRPEHLRHTAEPAGLNVTIESSEQTGSETLIQADLAGQSITALLRERFDCHPGERHRLTVDPAFAQLFDAETGARIDA
ncbi:MULTISPECIES: ABC transporter ATP-binding protein [Marinovum]|jgi:multiple sugar transport system ATP-binding protein|uniref:ABC transporter ATP-binding protein n=1 Tax=Marinovum TaxID=367771 RepID=UPI00065B268D|nr:MULTISPECIES: sn-glycerol-3-phosphate ABC transporter ATP-binding protein UgpC [Marinovum]AKO99962.1 ABC-type sugar transport system, ATPase component [Marinovum algicola DG 898]MDD9739682.1 sn-glycerol-3-phosphate ABC transporter ATP-binding protein UgpC [Marinovum sp. SP66]MDD9744938.1 sn-glycerol-3-phosphate ABC transporter ATP-binding protein UgpC [Marinovum sp. PR37]